MTIAVTTPAPNNSPLYRLGQGLRIIGTISGPTAIDDVLVAWLTDAFIGTIACWGSFPLAGGTAFDLPFDDPLTIAGGVADNRLVTLQLEGRHADGTMFDSQSYSGGYTHDPYSGLASFLLRTVYAAVHKVYV